jgi:hypothetical protein
VAILRRFDPSTAIEAKLIAIVDLIGKSAGVEKMPYVRCRAGHSLVYDLLLLSGYVCNKLNLLIPNKPTSETNTDRTGSQAASSDCFCPHGTLTFQYGGSSA